MAGIAEAFPGHRLLVEGGRDQHVDVPCLDVADRPLQGGHRRLGGFGRGLSRLHEYIVGQAVDDIDPFRMGILGGIDHMGVQGIDLVDEPLVEAEDLGGTVDHGRERLQDARIAQGLDDHFISDAVAIALRDAYDRFSFICHIMVRIRLSLCCHPLPRNRCLPEVRDACTLPPPAGRSVHSPDVRRGLSANGKSHRASGRGG